jgi:hypothetical protein
VSNASKQFTGQIPSHDPAAGDCDIDPLARHLDVNTARVKALLDGAPVLAAGRESAHVGSDPYSQADAPPVGAAGSRAVRRRTLDDMRRLSRAIQDAVRRKARKNILD